MSVVLTALVSFRCHKKWLWLSALLPLLFVSDILYGTLEHYGIELTITPGVILRGLVMLAAFYMMFIYQRLVGKSLQLWIGLMVLSLLPSLIISAFHGKNLFFDLSMLSKVLYLPFVTGLFVVLIRRYRLMHDEVLRFVEYAAYMLGISLLVSQELGLEKQTYGDYAFGSTGIFHAQNDMTLAFGLALLAGGYRLVMVKFNWFRLCLFCLSTFACMQIGTRASLMVVGGTAITAVGCAIWNSQLHRSRGIVLHLKRLLVIGLVLIAMGGMLVYGLGKQQSYGFQQQKLEQLVEGNLPRSSLVSAGMSHIAERDQLYNLTGEGAEAFQRGVAKKFNTDKDRRVVEVDWVDIFGGYGLGFVLLIHGFVLTILFGSAWRFIIKRDVMHGLISAATILFLGHAAFAGHALTSPIPSTLAAAYFSVYFTAIYDNRYDRRGVSA